ncbi:head-tail adaptor protein [Zavarzinia aquatilis]|uniref:Head-tail adaptor protein n=1 Tax=Zavarzinia aquatilis TaxID=2211142 RepID=A0A317EBX1_9PROT|nr:head-tail adaptor protein [Zavarzinia aquatilis]PWR24568.1 head-tail adaptor protein [Zavarzinia aquatilis]
MTGAGDLVRRVAFDARDVLDDGFGNGVETWQQRLVCRAGFTFLRGGESVIAARLEGRQPIVVRVRASSSTRQIGADWRMRDLRAGAWAADAGGAYWAGPVYAVRSVIPSPDRQWLDIMVESGVAA